MHISSLKKQQLVNGFVALFVYVTQSALDKQTHTLLYLLLIKAGL